jgi:tetratricopeptide (TPR) repeat protein
MAAIEEGDYPAAAAACERALAIAQRDGDVRLEIQALGNGAEADLNFARWQAGLDKCLRAIDLAGRTDAPQAVMLARFFASIILYVSGDLRRAGEQTAALLAQAIQLRDRRWMVSALWIDATVARYRGDWAAARERTDRGLALSSADPRLLWTRISLEHEAGDLVVVQSLMTRLLEIVPLSPPAPEFAQATTALVVALVTAEEQGGDIRHQAEAAAQAILSMSSATDMVRRSASACVAMMAVDRSDVNAAKRHYAGLQSARGTIIYMGMAADRLLGRVAETMGDRRAAKEHFEDALNFCRSRGCLPELAWSCYDFASQQCAHGEPDGAARAGAMLDEALAIARQVGMRPLMSSGLALRARTKAQQRESPRRQYGPGLPQGPPHSR